MCKQRIDFTDRSARSRRNDGRLGKSLSSHWRGETAPWLSLSISHLSVCCCSPTYTPVSFPLCVWWWRDSVRKSFVYRSARKRCSVLPQWMQAVTAHRAAVSHPSRLCPSSSLLGGNRCPYPQKVTHYSPFIPKIMSLSHDEYSFNINSVPIKAHRNSWFCLLFHFWQEHSCAASSLHLQM